MFFGILSIVFIIGGALLDTNPSSPTWIDAPPPVDTIASITGLPIERGSVVQSSY